MTQTEWIELVRTTKENNIYYKFRKVMLRYLSTGFVTYKFCSSSDSMSKRISIFIDMFECVDVYEWIDKYYEEYCS